MVSRKRHPQFVFFMLILLCFIVPAVVSAEPPPDTVDEDAPALAAPFPLYAVANVDGSDTEWRTDSSYELLWVNGDTSNNNNLRGFYYLRYDCRANRRILYALVTQANGSRLLTAQPQRITINGVTQVSSTVGDNDNAPDFGWILSGYTPPTAFRYEALFPLAPGNYTTFDIVVTIMDTDGVTKTMHTSGSSDRVDVSNTACSLAVELASFEATAQTDTVLVTWQTASETDNLGFNLYRSTVAEEVGEQLNGALIPSQAPGSGQGADYEFTDDTGQPGTTYYYRLEDVDLDGTATMHGPVSAIYPTEPSVVTLTGLDTNAPAPRWAVPLSALALGLLGIALSRRRFRSRA